MSSEQDGRSAAGFGLGQSGGERVVVAGCQDAPTEVVEFIRYCYRRRGIGWPELYDEMCAAAARGSYRGMDYEQLADLGIGFSLAQLPRLAKLARAVVADERLTRSAEPRRARPIASGGQPVTPSGGST